MAIVAFDTVVCYCHCNHFVMLFKSSNNFSATELAAKWFLEILDVHMWTNFKHPGETAQSCYIV